jgi:hypothetical protein
VGGAGASLAESSISPGQTAGIVLGILLTMLLVSCAFFFLVRARRQRKAVDGERERKEAAAAARLELETERLSELAAGTGLKHNNAAMTENPLRAAMQTDGEHHVPVAAADEVAATDDPLAAIDLTNRSARTASISSPVDARALASALESFALANSMTPATVHESPEDAVNVPGSVPQDAAAVVAAASASGASKRRLSFKLAAGRAAGRGWRPTAPRRGDAPGTLQFNPLRSKSVSSSKKAAAAALLAASPPSQQDTTSLTIAPTPAAMPALEPTTAATAAPPPAQSSTPPQPTPTPLERTVTDLGEKIETVMRSLSLLGSPASNAGLAPARATVAAPIFPPADWASHRAGPTGGAGPASPGVGEGAGGAAEAWELRVSRSTGEQYYFNPITRQHVHGWVEHVSRRTGGKYFMKEVTKQHALSLNDAFSLDNADEAFSDTLRVTAPPVRTSSISEQRLALSKRQEALGASLRGGDRVDGDDGDDDDDDDDGDDQERPARDDRMQSPAVQPNEWLRKWTSRGQEMFVNFFTKAKMLTRPRGAKIFVQRGGEFVLEDTDNGDGDGGGNGDVDDDGEPRSMIVNPMRRGGLAGGGGGAERSTAAAEPLRASGRSGLRKEALAESFSVANPLRRTAPPSVVNFGAVDDVLPSEDVHDDPRSYLERYDDDKGAPFYFHITTSTTTWHPPRGSRVYRTEDDNALTRIADSEIDFDE